MRADKFVAGNAVGSVRFGEGGLRVRRDEELMRKGRKMTINNRKSISC